MLTGSVIQILNYSSWKVGVIYVSIFHCFSRFSSEIFDFRIMQFQSLCTVGSFSVPWCLLDVVRVNVPKAVWAHATAHCCWSIKNNPTKRKVLSSNRLITWIWSGEEVNEYHGQSKTDGKLQCLGAEWRKRERCVLSWKVSVFSAFSCSFTLNL